MQLCMIRAFLQLWEDRSISLSSAKLNISQQGLSRQLAAMESELGTAFFLRSRHGLVPTAAAEIIYPVFSDIYRQYEDMLHRLHRLESPNVIRLGFTYSTAQTSILNCVLSYQTEHPHTLIQISSMTDSEGEQQLARGDLDVAFLISPDPALPFRKTLLFHSSACAVMNRTHRLASRASLSISDLRDEMVYLPNRQYRMRRLFDEHFGDAEGLFRRVFSSGEHREYIRMPSRSEGVALTFTLFCNDLSEDLVCLPMQEDFPADVFCCFSETSAATPLLREFTAYLSQSLPSVFTP